MSVENFGLQLNSYSLKDIESKPKVINSDKILTGNIPINKEVNSIETDDSISVSSKVSTSKKMEHCNSFLFDMSAKTIDPPIDPEKAEKMKKSPYSYFRATNDEFRKNANEDPKLKELMKTNVPDITIQGDSHLENVGAYKTDDGKLGFGFNDFDDSIKGSYKMDVGRLTTSIRFMGKEKGLNDNQIDGLVKEFLTTYTKKIGEYQSDKNKEPNFDSNDLISKLNSKIIGDNGNFIKERTETDPTTKETKFNYNVPAPTPEDPNPKAKSGLKKITDETIKNSVKNSIDLNEVAKRLGVDVKDLKITDIANRTAGTASLGSDRYAVLIENSKTEPKSYTMLDIKEAKDPSNTRKAMTEYLGKNSDFGETKIGDKKFYIKDLSALGENIKVDKNKDPVKIEAKMKDLVDAIGEMMAKKHIDFGQGDKIISEVGELEKDMTEFSKIMYDKLVSSYEKFK